MLTDGLGTRFQKVIPNLPKRMAQVAARPLLKFILVRLSRHGFSRIVLSVCRLADPIEAHFGASYSGTNLIYVKEHLLLGRGRSIRKALAQCQSAYVYGFDGDTSWELEILDLNASWQPHRQPHIVGQQVADTSRYGQLESKNGMVTNFYKKGAIGGG